MSNPELVPVTILVPPPPETHEIVPGRVPLGGEEHFLFVPLNDAWVLQKGPSKGDKYRILAFPKPRPKRLLTPAELAGKWLRIGDMSYLILGCSKNEIHTLPGGWNPVRIWHESGCGYSDTPTGECKPLEMEEP